MYGESGREVRTAPDIPPQLMVTAVESDKDAGTAPGHLPPLMIITAARGDAGNGKTHSYPPRPHPMINITARGDTGIGTAPSHPRRPHLPPHHPLHQVVPTNQDTNADE